MGSEGAPDVEVLGALEAARTVAAGHEILLVGDRVRIERALDLRRPLPPNLEIVHASEVIGMADPPLQGLRRKREASVLKALELASSGGADAVVTAGNTGAAAAGARMVLGMLPGVERPAICTLMPSARGYFALLDAGANTDSRPAHLLQFALMGARYFDFACGRARPRVALLNIGSESGKGNELTRGAHQLLAAADLDFIGNIEASRIFMGEADVVVADGFVGNILLKASEGVAAAIQGMLTGELRGNVFRSIGGWLLRPVFKRLGKRISPEEYGGAPLLGVRGTCIICHGASTPRAISCALGAAVRYSREKVNDKISAAVSQTAE